MDYIAQPRDYWIAPKAIFISPNALGEANRLQCSVASGATIMCYIYGTDGDGLGYDNGHQYKAWPLTIAPTYFNTDTEKYVYCAIPKDQTIGTQAQIVFPSEQLDIYGKNASDEQVGSTDFYFIFLQGILSAVQTDGNTSSRQWAQEMNSGLLDTDQARNAKIDETEWYSYSRLQQVVTFLKEIVMNPGATFRNIFLGLNGGKELTSVATDIMTPTSSTTAVATPAYALSKILPDRAKEKIVFEKGAEYGDFQQDASGAAIWKDEQDGWHVESDFLHARRKLIAKEVQIEKVSHIGGSQLLTAASMKCDFVDEKETCYRCFFLKVGLDGKQIFNQWKMNDQAYVNTFNLEKKDNETMGNHYLWRLVVATSNDTSDTGTYTVDGEEVDASKYHFIDLSKTVCGAYSDAPQAGDDIVQLGYQGTDDVTRQNAIILAGAGEASPYIREFTGINSFSLPLAETQLKPGDNILSGLVRMKHGTTLPNGEELAETIGGLANEQENLRNAFETLSTGNANMLRNTGFVGDYESGAVSQGTIVKGDTQMFSPCLEYWEHANATVAENANSASGMAATIANGYLRQNVEETLELGETYCISIKATGTSMVVNFGGHAATINVDGNLKRHVFKARCSSPTSTLFKISGSCTVMEIMLTKGAIPNTDWLPSPLDNDKSLAAMQNLSYLRNAIQNASTSVLGGLVLTQMIRVGNYRDGVMNGETGGMSGLCNGGGSPFLWGGGDMRQAFYAIAKYAQDPAYQATEDEVAQMAKFVVTHGGRAILNDIVLRGYIYALGGYFKGNLEIGKLDKFIVDAISGEMRMNGPQKVLDEPGFPVDETSARIDLFKIFYEVDPDTFCRVARMLLNSADGSYTLDAQFGLKGQGSANESVTLDYNNGFKQKNGPYTVSLGNGELVFEDASGTAPAQMRFDGNKMEWFFNGVKTAGGTLTIDGNGFLKILQN